MGDFDKSDVYIIPVEQLKPNPWNPNEMGETAWQALGQSIVKHGIHLQPLVVRPHGDGFQIIDGEHRYKWACEMGIPSVSAVVADVDDFQAKKLTQILNRVRGEDNPIQLKELLDSLLVDHTPDEVIEGMAIANEQELNHLLADLEKQIMNDYDLEESKEGLTEDDEIPDDAPTRVKRGDIWQLGNHRVMCGDSTNSDDVGALMDGEKADMVFTDPPYGVNYEGGHFHSGDVNIKRKREKLQNDFSDQIYADAIPVIASFCDGPCYTWFADTKALNLYQSVEKYGQVHALIIWHKTNATYAAMNAQYKQRHEPCLYWKPKGSTLRWVGPSDERTIWEIKRDAQNNFHPTQKPVELAERAIKNHDAPKVMDLFLGSGSTLIACEKTNRTCYGMELSEKYCDVIIQRWEDFTGQTAIKINMPSQKC